MSLQKKLRLQRARRTFRVRNKFMSKGIKPRVSVFRSAKHIYVQIIDDKVKTTLASFSSLSLNDKSGDKKSIANKVGLELGKIAQSKSIKDVFFDRGKYCYHGRVRALAEGLRSGGLEF